MEIVLTRGDTQVYTFTIKTDSGENYVLGEEDKLYFTVKKNWFDKGCVLQKTFGNGITYNSGTKEYEIDMTHDCTCNLDCCDYVFDIELIVNGSDAQDVKTLAKGVFTLDVEATHKGNEV